MEFTRPLKAAQRQTIIKCTPYAPDIGIYSHTHTHTLPVIQIGTLTYTHTFL